MTTPFRILTGSLLALLLVGAVDYDHEGNWEGPVLCPLNLPGGTWSFSPITFYVPRWMLPEGDEIPFHVTSLTYTSQIQPVMLGQGWYVPSPTTKQHENVTWTWQANAGPPGVLYTCREAQWLWGAIVIRTATWAGQIWGHAFPSSLPPAGSGTRPGGGGEQICWEYFEYWYDAHGTYHEEVLATWCENPAET